MSTALQQVQHRAAARLELLRREAANDVEAAVEYAGTVQPGSARTRWERPRHLRPLTSLLNASLAGQPVFALCSVPPRHGKTETILHFLVAMLKRYPKLRVAYVTYSAEQARRKSLRTLQIARALGLGLGRKSVAADPLDRSSTAVSYWQTAGGGTFAAVGRSGAITGEGFDVVVVDDPYKNREEAESPVIRRKIWDLFADVAYTRLEPGGSIFIVHTRWHEDDLIGRLGREAEKAAARRARGGELDEEDAALGEDWRHVNLPALREVPAANDTGKLEEVPLWPQRFDRANLSRKRATLGPHSWASLYQGEPRPRGARLFSEPARLTCGPVVPIPRGAWVVISADAAGTEKTSADHSALVVAAYWRQKTTIDDEGTTAILLHARMLYAWKGQVTLPDFADQLHAVQKRFPGAPIIVEQQGGEGRATVQNLNRLDKRLRVFGVPAVRDKFTRAQPVSAAWNALRYQVPLLPWAADVLSVLGLFTGVGDAEDDLVDAVAHGWNWAEKKATGAQSRSGRRTASIGDALGEAIPRAQSKREGRSRHADRSRGSIRGQF